MRVVGGLYKSRKLVYPNNKTTRPTSDMVKVAVFNMLNINDGIVLDLFAGSGAYGIEALSRGAKFSHFVDNNNDAINSILTNIKTLEIKNSKVYKMSYEKFLKTNRIIFDYIFLDPPFQFNKYKELLKEIKLFLNDNGYIILEVDKAYVYEDNPNYLLLKEKIYGNKKIIILHNK